MEEGEGAVVIGTEEKYYRKEARARSRIAQVLRMLPIADARCERRSNCRAARTEERKIAVAAKKAT